MKKIIATILVVFLTIGSFSALAISEKTENISLQTSSSKVDFSKISIKQKNEEYLEIDMQDVSTYLVSAGKPVLPKIVKTIELPFFVENIDVEVELGGSIEQKISKDVSPSPYMMPLTTAEINMEQIEVKDKTVYESSNPYPEKTYDYEIKCGLNKEDERVKFVIIDIYPVRYVPSENILNIFDSADIKITYEKTSDKLQTKGEETTKDMVIITPKIFERYLTKLKEHKDEYGVETEIITTEEIYKEYEGFDEPEQIKKYIKDAIDEDEIKYVLLVGGLKNQVFAKPRDNVNKGVSGWYLPVRYTNLYDKPKYPLNAAEQIFDPGVISDLYYADVFDGEGKFSTWDPNEDGTYAAWGKEGVEDDLGIDMVPDVYVGRLACRNVKEVKTVVDKIINYEAEPKDDWFNKMTVVSGDGFLDQEDFNITWDTTGLKGEYTIYGQSINKDDEAGPTDIIHITIDRSKETSISFNHDDHLNSALDDGYPAPPITEIVSISTGDILGYDPYEYVPGEGEAYCNGFNPWANISYVDGVLTIRGKSYDPQPYGNLTDLHIWIKDEYGETVFSEWKNNTEMYYEGEWTTGEESLLGRGGALHYMPSEFERDIVWTSNGELNGPDDVINAINKGAGFLFFSGHGSPNVWADHYPGVPGNRGGGSVTGLEVTKLSLFNIGGMFIGQRKPKDLFPLYPMDTLSNGEKLPVTVVGGCHNSQFNVSMIPGFLEGFGYLFPNLKLFQNMYMWCHGTAVPECFNWRLVRNPNGGSIASIGNTGLGYGMPGKLLTTGGGDGWITIEFFRQYGEHGQTTLGDAHSQAINTYIQTHDMSDFEAGHPKSVQQWTLLGDPSLKIGGYE